MIVWVLGATAVGKKHFIERALRDPAGHGLPGDIRSFWFEDGDKTIDEIFEAHACYPLLIRWQWGRENNFGPIQERGIEQRLYVIRTDVQLQYQRAFDREGGEKWPSRMLYREAEDVDHLAQQVSMQLGLSVRYFSGN